MKGHTYSKRNPAPMANRAMPSHHSNQLSHIMAPFMRQYGKTSPDQRVMKWGRMLRRILQCYPRGKRALKAMNRQYGC